jgi:hypothetical protein
VRASLVSLVTAAFADVHGLSTEESR